nr:integrase, catalytic region, zinc finger, CCHC-type, peptidase aspartic, catalytic [Tanacetum cinerariifolium]
MDSIIPVGQKNTLAEYLILSGADNRPPTLDKDLKESVNSDLEKKIKELDNIIFKVGQSAQAMHILIKPQAFYDNIPKQALCYQNPFYLKNAQRIKTTLYDGIAISAKLVAMLMIDDEETLILKEEKVPSELPKVSLVNASLKKLKFYLAQFDSVVKKRTTRDACKEGKEIVDIAVQTPFAYTIVPSMFKVDLKPLAPRFLQNREVYIKYLGLKWKPTGETFTIFGNSCPLTKITSANVVPPEKTTSYSVETQKLELKVYSRKPENVKNIGSSKKAKIVESKKANHSEPNHTWGSSATDIPSSSSLVMTVRFGNNHIARIMRYGNYQLENVTISRVYYIEGLGHNLFSIGPFYEADLEVRFQKNTCFIVNLEVQEVTASRAVVLAESIVSTSIDQDAPSSSIPSTQEQKHSPNISQGSSLNVRQTHTPSEHLGEWTKDHPIENKIGDPSCFVSTRKQLKTDAMWCYFDAFLTFIKPKTFKQAMTEPSWIDAVQ